MMGDCWFLGIVAGKLIQKNDIEKRFIYFDPAVVFDEAELAEPIHEEADAGPRRTDHLCQRFLRNGGNAGIVLSRLTEFGHEQKNARQAFFAGVEELVYEIGLRSHAASQHKFKEEVGK